MVGRAAGGGVPEDAESGESMMMIVGDWIIIIMGEEEVKLQLNPDGWGPMAGLPPFAKTYEGLMFSVYDKTEAVGKLCDFLTQTGRREREKLEK